MHKRYVDKTTTTTTMSLQTFSEPVAMPTPNPAFENHKLYFQGSNFYLQKKSDLRIIIPIHDCPHKHNEY